jgi:hypothetical protein
MRRIHTDHGQERSRRRGAAGWTAVYHVTGYRHLSQRLIHTGHRAGQGKEPIGLTLSGDKPYRWTRASER